MNNVILIRKYYKMRQHDITDLIHAHDEADNRFGETMEKLVKVATGALKALKGSNIEEKRELLSFVFSNLQLKGSTLCYQYKFPFDKFENMGNCTEWRRDGDSNPGRACTLAGFQDQCIQPLCHPSTTSALSSFRGVRQVCCL